MKKGVYVQTSQWKKFTICVTFLSFLVLSAAPLTAHAAKIDDQKVIIVLDTTHAKGTSCTLGAKTRSSTGMITTTEVPCPVGTLWEMKIVSQSQAIAMHELYTPLPSSANPQSIAQIASRIKSQKKILLTKATSNVLPATSCNSTTYHFVNWHVTGGGDNYVFESGVDYYVSSNCRNALLDYSDVFFASTISNSAPRDVIWSFDRYAGTTYSVMGWIYDFKYVGDYYTHTLNSLQPIGYTFETLLELIGYQWPDIPVN